MAKKSKGINTKATLNYLFKTTYGKSLEKYFTGSHTTVDQWMYNRLITQEDLDRYPNARIAKELKESPLADVMSEGPKSEPGDVQFTQLEIINPKTFNGLMDLIAKDTAIYGQSHIVITSEKKKKNAKS